MKCDKCGKQIVGTYFTAVGVVVCKSCNEEGDGKITLDMVLDKIIREEKTEGRRTGINNNQTRG